MTTAMLTMFNRRWLPFVILGLLLDLAISGVLIWLSVTTLSTANKAQHTAAATNKVAATQYQTCLDANKTRASERQLWRELFATSLSTEHLTPAEQALAARQEKALLAVIDKQFAPVKCPPLPKS